MATEGVMPTVKGSKSAMAIEGDMPGRAPPNIPHKTPPNAASSIQPDSRPVSKFNTSDIDQPDSNADQIPVGKRTLSNASKSSHSKGPVRKSKPARTRLFRAPANQATAKVNSPMEIT